jgi:P-type Cu2+ transporter
MNHTNNSMNHHMGHAAMFKKLFYSTMPLVILIVILSDIIGLIRGVPFLTFPYQSYTLAFLSTILFIIGGKPFLDGLINETKNQKPGMMTLVTVAITASYIYSIATVFGLKGEPFWWELSTLISVMLFGHWLEMSATEDASNSLAKLAELLPKFAHRYINKTDTEDVELETLIVGDRVLIKPFETIPSDGIISTGNSTINESMVTGESLPVEKTIGDQVIGGSLNQQNAFDIIIQKTGDSTFIAQVSKLVSEAQLSKSKLQTLSDTAAMYLTYSAIVISILTFIYWALVDNKGIAFALAHAVTVLVIACPHALGLAIPLVIARTTSIAAKNGLIIRNRQAFETARNITNIIFDKTGTLTEGIFTTLEVAINKPHDKNYLLMIIASIESNSEHPVATALKSLTSERINVTQVESIPGVGIQGFLNQKKYIVASSNYVKQKNLAIPQELLPQKVGTTVYLISEETVLAMVTLGDTIREVSKEVIVSLHAMNIKVSMLTGDAEVVAKQVSNELGIDSYQSEVKPKDKSEFIQNLKNSNSIVSMVGDGVNDAPALSISDVAIAIGAGTDVAIESADIILVNNNPKDIPAIISLSKASYLKMQQNLWWASGYNIFTIPIAAGVLNNYGVMVSPAIAGLLMALSSIIVSVNAQRLEL